MTIERIRMSADVLVHLDGMVREIVGIELAAPTEQPSTRIDVDGEQPAGRHDTPFDERIAMAVHGALREYAVAIAEPAMPRWDAASGLERAALIEGARAITTGEAKTPADVHERWRTGMTALGWAYAPMYDEHAKRHPSLVPYAELTPEQRRKAVLSFQIAYALTTPV